MCRPHLKKNLEEEDRIISKFEAESFSTSRPAPLQRSTIFVGEKSIGSRCRIILEFAAGRRQPARFRLARRSVKDWGEMPVFIALRNVFSRRSGTAGRPRKRQAPLERSPIFVGEKSIGSRCRIILEFAAGRRQPARFRLARRSVKDWGEMPVFIALRNVFSRRSGTAGRPRKRQAPLERSPIFVGEKSIGSRCRIILEFAAGRPRTGAISACTLCRDACREMPVLIGFRNGTP